jgi:hypothetical protein
LKKVKPKNLFEKGKTKNMGFGSTYLPFSKVEPNNLFEKGKPKIMGFGSTFSKGGISI